MAPLERRPQARPSTWALAQAACEGAWGHLTVLVWYLIVLV